MAIKTNYCYCCEWKYDSAEQKIVHVSRFQMTTWKSSFSFMTDSCCTCNQDSQCLSSLCSESYRTTTFKNGDMKLKCICLLKEFNVILPDWWFVLTTWILWGLLVICATVAWFRELGTESVTGALWKVPLGTSLVSWSCAQVLTKELFVLNKEVPTQIERFTFKLPKC